MTVLAGPICAVCCRLRGDLSDPRCDAYPKGIPRAILTLTVDHRAPFEGDGGMTFVPANAAAARYADEVLGTRP